MKIAKLIVVVGLAAAAAFAAEPTQVQNDQFSMTLPTGFGDFAKQTQTVSSPDGKKTEVTTYVSKSPTGEVAVVSVSKMPGKVDDADKLFASTRDALLKTTNGTLDKEEKLPGSNPGERLWFHSSNGAFLRSRLLVVGDTLYNVLYVGHSEEQRNNPAVASMLDTFMPANAQPVAQTTTATTTSH
ncbi:MAG TPA: hypothetical protein VL284_16680 [Thermoanaerobaculia bacterium]|nr:hypothetical protein [Thermoanaerobaculia bacterium]